MALTESGKGVILRHYSYDLLDAEERSVTQPLAVAANGSTVKKDNVSERASQC
jgi:hypothetical protein